MFKELGHLVGGQRLRKTVGDHVFCRHIYHLDLVPLDLLSQPVIVDIDVSEFCSQLGGFLIYQPDCLCVVALDRNRGVIKLDAQLGLQSYEELCLFCRLC
jgi:hypothetical protein